MKYFFVTLPALLLSFTSFALIEAISGPSNLCAGATVTMIDTTSGGAWASSNTTVATIGATSGIITGVAAGTSVISYIVGGSFVIDTITVNPIPTLSSSLTAPPLCDSLVFNYTPMSATIGTEFSWSRPAVTGIADAANSGIGNPNEELINVSNLPVLVPYIYTLSAAGCINTQTVTVTVNPTPKLSSSLTLSLCDTFDLDYVPVSPTPGASFMWARSAVAGISNPTASDTGTIHEMLVDTTSAPVTVIYNFIIIANGCTNHENVSVTVDTCKTNEVLMHSIESDNIFPNPNTGSFTLYLASAATQRAIISITNLSGEKIKEWAVDTNKNTEIQLDAPPGVYFVSATLTGTRYYSKIIVTK